MKTLYTSETVVRSSMDTNNNKVDPGQFNKMQAIATNDREQTRIMSELEGFDLPRGAEGAAQVATATTVGDESISEVSVSVH